MCCIKNIERARQVDLSPWVLLEGYYIFKLHVISPDANHQLLFCLFDSLNPSQHFFSHDGMGIPGLNQY